MKWKKLFPDFKKAELFAVDEKFLSMLGFWPGNVINTRSIFFVISCLSLEIIPELCFIIKNIHDIQKVFMCLHEFISLIVLMIKIFILLLNKDEMFDLISNLRNEWKNCKSCVKCSKLIDLKCNYHLNSLQNRESTLLGFIEKARTSNLQV